MVSGVSCLWRYGALVIRCGNLYKDFVLMESAMRSVERVGRIAMRINLLHDSIAILRQDHISHLVACHKHRPGQVKGTASTDAVKIINS